MKEFRIDFKVTEYGSVHVEAETKEQALDLYIEAIDQGNADYNKIEYNHINVIEE